MSDFTIRLDSTLDLSKAQSQINSFISKYNSNPIKLNVSLNTQGINTASLGSQLQSSFASAGTSAGKAFTKNMESSISSNNINSLISRLNAKGISKDIVSGAEKSLNTLTRAGIQINKIKEVFSGDNLLSLKIDGVDKAENAVSVVDKLNKKTKEWTSTTTYTTSFKDIAKDAESVKTKLLSLDEIKTRLFKAQGNVGSLQAQFGNVDKFSQDFNKLGTSINNALSQANNGNINQLSVTLAEIESKVKTLTASTREWHKTNQTNTDITSAASKQLAETEKALSKQKELQSALNAFKKQNATLFDPNSKYYSSTIVDDFNKVQNAINKISSISDSKVASNMLSGLRADAKNLNAEISSLAKPFSQLDATTASNKTLTWLKNNSKAAKDYGDKLKYLASQQRSATSAEELRGYTKQVSAIQAEAAALGKTGRSVTDELSRGFKKIGQFALTYGIIQRLAYQVPRAISQAVISIDDSVTQLKKVSDATDLQISSYFDEAAASAKKYGQTISDVIATTADWSRLGYSLEDSKLLSDITTLYQNVGDNMTQESASSSMISTLQGFQMQADEAMHIVDTYNEVGNRFAIGSDGIGEALQRSASSMYAANNSFEQTVGLVTAAKHYWLKNMETYFYRTYLIARAA